MKTKCDPEEEVKEFCPRIENNKGSRGKIRVAAPSRGPECLQKDFLKRENKMEKRVAVI